MQVFFKTRDAARKTMKAHKLVDNGPKSPKGKRFARDISAYKKESRENSFWQDVAKMTEHDSFALAA